MKSNNILRGLTAISPIIVLLTVYLVGSLIAGDFYRIPITVAFLTASIYAIAISRFGGIEERVNSFSGGAANSRIMYMVWIFVLAGAFAQITKAMGAVDATVTITLKFIPANYLPAGIFAAACFISLSIGTSVGTIVALAPMVNTLAEQTGFDTAWLVAIVVGGAFFGDNLSFISDTTIAATQTQGCSMRSKFYTNFRLVAPAAIITLLIYAFSGNSAKEVAAPAITLVEALKCLPYIIVIVSALFGVNVLTVLVTGIVASGAMGLTYGSFGEFELFSHIGNGILSMGELIIVTMLAGGLLEIVRINGGIEYLIGLTTARIASKKSAEFAIVALTAMANICTANNTIAILTVGDISRDIANTFKIAPRRSASLLDTASCFVQGVLPYGAQLLMAAGLTKVSPVAIIPHLYYPMCVGAFIILSILLQRNKKAV